MKKIIIAFIFIVLLGIGACVLIKSQENGVTPAEEQATTTTGVLEGEENTDPDGPGITVIGTSVEGRDISAYHYGTGETELLFVGGIHGGYEWNTTLVAYELMDHLEESPEAVPDGLKVTVIPVLNPDGLYATLGTAGRFSPSDVPDSETETMAGRFNANDVDLNRNFDCDWQESGTWQNRTVSGGDEVFSEPESQALRDYVEANSPSAAVVWYSAAGGVFASSCHNGISPETLALTNAYAEASGYRAYEEFDFYEITGDMVNWLAKKNIPAISVLLTTHDSIEWEKNLAGIEAMFEHYAE